MITSIRTSPFPPKDHGSLSNGGNAVFFLTALYFASHVWIFFLGNSVFWDDWVIYPPSPEVLIEKFLQAGSPFGGIGYLHLGLRSIGPPVYKLLTFLSYLASGIALFFILKRQDGHWAEHSFLIAALFLILPLNAARVASINLPYALCYLLFFLAWWAIDRHRKLALLLFFLSFITNSLLVFYAIPVVDLLIRRYGNPLKTGFKFVRENYDLILLPFVFWTLKLLFFRPYGLYEGYNTSFSFENLIYSLGLQFNEFLVDGFWKFTLFSGFVIYFIVRSAITSHAAIPYRSALLTLLAGLALLFIAEFPYLVLGHTPRFYAWNSRHQLLMPLGSAVSFLGLSMFLFGKARRNFVLLILGLSITANFLSYAEYAVDWAKQQEIMRLIAGREEIMHGRLIVFEDHTGIPNAKDRSIAYYEWNGMLASLYGNERRFGVTQQEWSNDFCNSEDRRFNKHYSAADVPRDTTGDVVLVKIENTLNMQSAGIIRRLKSMFDPHLSVHIETGKDYCSRLGKSLSES